MGLWDPYIQLHHVDGEEQMRSPAAPRILAGAVNRAEGDMTVIKHQHGLFAGSVQAARSLRWFLIYRLCLRLKFHRPISMTLQGLEVLVLLHS